MKNTVLLLVAVCLFSGCATLPPSPESINGEWYFAHFRQVQSVFGEFPAPPQFDSIMFTQPNIINISDSLGKMSFDGTYMLSGHDLSYEFHPPDINKPIKHNLKCSLEENGETLILTYEQNELVYYRPERFYPNEIVGEWVVEADEQSEIMRLGEDGSYLMVKSNVIGNYRLWPSRFGKVMTAIVFIPGHGGYLMIWKYEQKDDLLTLTPISFNGPIPENAVTWKLKIDMESSTKIE